MSVDPSIPAVVLLSLIGSQWELPRLRLARSYSKTLPGSGLTLSSLCPSF